MKQRDQEEQEAEERRKGMEPAKFSAWNIDFQGKEALNSICTNLSFVGRNMKSFVVTSCTENEGKAPVDADHAEPGRPQQEGGAGGL